MAAAADERFDFSKVVVFDPAVQRLHPWNGKIPNPTQFLAINSEEFAFGAEFPMLVEMLDNIELSNVFLIRMSSLSHSYTHSRLNRYPSQLGRPTRHSATSSSSYRII